MRIVACELQNFASYKELDFELLDKGLCLIQGPTGAGKSTLCDAVAWILFGRTAKGGTVDEIRSWNSDEPTTGTLHLENYAVMSITRTRGKINDLYYCSNPGSLVRGKDINDTQKLINKKLGIDYETYMLGAYFHEFCQSAQFFTTNAKNRRTVCEQIVNLELAVKLQHRIASLKKEYNNKIVELQTNINTKDALIQHLESYKEAHERKANDWNNNKNKELLSIKQNMEAFENKQKELILELSNQYERDVYKLRESTVCSECGAKKKPNKNADSPIKALIEQEKLKENKYIEYYDRVFKSINPYKTEIKDNSKEIDMLHQEVSILKTELAQNLEKLNDLETLEETVNSFRALVVKNTIVEIENKTNDLIEAHFDGEIKVEFDVTQADKLDVTIRKDGNICSYTQLSKGQRQLLKLCFGVSIMEAVANNSGIHFNQLFFDEALDGLSDELKVKAFSLFEILSLNHESVFVVDHCEALKSRFANRYDVELIGGNSVLCQN